MARKLEKPATGRKAKAAPNAGKDDLPIIHPNATLPIGGRTITVREYGLVEGTHVRARMQGFTRGLLGLFEQGEALVEDIMDLVAERFDEARGAIAISICPPDASPEQIDEAQAWIGTLGDDDGDLLLNTWWGVCGPFFVRQVLRRLVERLQRKGLAGQTSTSPLSTPDSAPPSSSADTPSAS